ncbi:MAG: HU family DNA-binding protein [Bacteroidetes bacterium]|nr:HU family DNA-binding protein [Bacteroidota bacterium]
MKITKSDLIRDVVRGSGVERDVADAVVNNLFRAVLDHLDQDHTIEIRGFGTFRLEDRKGKPARNPYRNEVVMVPAKKVPVLNFTREFKKQIGGKYSLE